MARRDAGSPLVRDFAAHIGGPENIDAGLRAIWRYVPDPPGVEYVAAPEAQIVRAMSGYRSSGAFSLWGDCDEAAVMAACLFCVFRVNSRLVAIRAANNAEFGHVYVQWVGGDVDATVPPEALPLTNYVEQMTLPV